MTTSLNDLNNKVTKIEGEINGIRADLSHTAELAKIEMTGVRSTLDKVGDAVELLLKNFTETALLKQDLANTKQEILELNVKMERRQTLTDPLILEAKEFLASFKTGTAVILKGLGLLQLILVGWLGYNETRMSELEQTTQQLVIASAAKTSILKVPH